MFFPKFCTKMLYFQFIFGCFNYRYLKINFLVQRKSTVFPTLAAFFLHSCEEKFDGAKNAVHSEIVSGSQKYSAFCAKIFCNSAIFFAFLPLPFHIFDAIIMAVSKMGICPGPKCENLFERVRSNMLPILDCCFFFYFFRNISATQKISGAEQ